MKNNIFNRKNTLDNNYYIKNLKIEENDLYKKEKYDILSLRSKSLNNYKSKKNIKLEQKVASKNIISNKNELRNYKTLNSNKTQKINSKINNILFKSKEYINFKDKSTQYKFSKKIKLTNQFSQTLNFNNFIKSNPIKNIGQNNKIKEKKTNSIENNYISTNDSNKKITISHHDYKINIIKDNFGKKFEKNIIDHSFLNPLYNINKLKRLKRDLKYFSKITVDNLSVNKDKIFSKEKNNKFIIYDINKVELFNINSEFDLDKQDNIMSFDQESQSQNLILKKSKKLKYNFYFEKNINKEILKFGFNDREGLITKLNNVKLYLENIINKPIDLTKNKEEFNNRRFTFGNRNSVLKADVPKFNFEGISNNIDNLKNIMNKKQKPNLDKPFNKLKIPISKRA